MQKTYDLGDIPTAEETDGASFNERYGHGKFRAIMTNEKRLPKKGEWYISGAIPTAYCACNDLSTVFHIAKLVRVELKPAEYVIV